MTPVLYLAIGAVVAVLFIASQTIDGEEWPERIFLGVVGVIIGLVWPLAACAAVLVLVGAVFSWLGGVVHGIFRS